ncbi:hypothetical protein Lal_00046224 [Lupinus albus]|nr:hypothetical protein Lal_00046224 [Lupinus albus]
MVSHLQWQPPQVLVLHCLPRLFCSPLPLALPLPTTKLTEKDFMVWHQFTKEVLILNRATRSVLEILE